MQLYRNHNLFQFFVLQLQNYSQSESWLYQVTSLRLKTQTVFSTWIGLIMGLYLLMNAQLLPLPVGVVCHTIHCYRRSWRILKPSAMDGWVWWTHGVLLPGNTLSHRALGRSLGGTCRCHQEVYCPVWKMQLVSAQIILNFNMFLQILPMSMAVPFSSSSLHHLVYPAFCNKGWHI